MSRTITTTLPQRSADAPPERPARRSLGPPGEGTPAPRVLVTHPGRQHSHQAALALQGADMLAGYWAGVPCLAAQRRRIPPALWRRLVRYAPVPLDGGRVRWFPWTPALRRAGDRFPGAAAGWIDFAACRLFDRWAARGVRRLGAAAVVACEISALATFRAARERGMTTILDAPSIHHREQDRRHGTSDPPALHHRITRIKDREIALADHVITVSPLARETYLAAGVPPERVHSVLLGADLDLFTPGSGDRPRSGSGCTFLFAGAMIRRKGFDLLVEAFARVRREVPDARLVIAGPEGEETRRLASVPPEGIVRLGPLPQERLAEELRAADCLVLPSRNDSYGMVVAEALAAGVPVLASAMVGAGELIREGESGWIVPVEDVPALADRMLRCARRPGELRAMGPACRRAGERAGWPGYHRRYAALIRSLIAGEGAA